MTANTIATNDITTELEATGKKLLHVLSSFTQEEINAVPFEGSWTAAQVTDHLVKSISGISMLLDVEVKATDRDPAEKAQAIKDLFLNPDLKFVTAANLEPSTAPQNKEALLTELKNVLDKITGAAKTKDLSGTYTDREVPVFGQLTKLEFCYLTVYHTQKHINQLENIKKLISK